MTTNPDTTVPATIVLPPFSGDDTPCAKCRQRDAFTSFRPAVPPGRRENEELNGRTLRGPLPERLRRRCTRCGFEWDEALPVDDATEGGITLDDLAHALDNATPYRVELDPAVARFMAERLVEMVAVYPIPGHPVWQPDATGPEPVAPQAPGQICEIPHETREDEEACERQRLATDQQQEA